MSYSTNIALFVGAGFSKWAVNLPLAFELFDFSINPLGQRDSTRLDVVRQAKEHWDNLHPAGLAEEFIADALSYPHLQRNAVLWYLARRLSEPFIWTERYAFRTRRHTLMIDEYRKFQVPGVNKAQQFLQRFWKPALTGIITTNYDLVVEYALGTKGFNYGTQGEILSGRGPYPVSTRRNPVCLTGTIHLAKIHGSLSWDVAGHYTDARRAITGNALIVPPTQGKQPPPILESTWELAANILSRATSAVVFGFSFNPYDEAVNELLKSNGRDLEAVLLVNPDTDIARARMLWPSANITHCLPPPNGEQAIQEWLKPSAANAQ